MDDFNGDGRRSASIAADGTLWFYPGNGQGGFTSPVRIGSGWRIYSRIVGVGDFNGDGRNDFTAIKPDGSMWFYAGTGTVGAGSQGYASAIKMGTTNWSAFSQVAGVRDFNGDGRNDLVASKKDGTLWFFAGTRAVSSTQSGYAPELKIGSSGWDAYISIVGVRNFGGKPTNDLLATKTDGSLWFYDGTGAVSATNPGYAPGTRIGTSGWNNFLDVPGAGDGNGDGKADLLTRRRDNALLFYAGTGMNEAGYKPAVNIGTSSWNNFPIVESVQDFNGDKRPDLLAVARTALSGSTPQPGPTDMPPAARSGPAGTPTPSSSALATSTATGKVISSPSGPTEVSGSTRAPGICPPAVRAIPPAGRWARVGMCTASSSQPVTLTRTARTTWPVSARTARSGSTTAPGRCPQQMRGTPAASRSDPGGQASIPSPASRTLTETASTISPAYVPMEPCGFMPEPGRSLGTSPGYRPGQKIGTSGWNAYSILLGAGRLNADGTPDLAAVNRNGSLWFYAGAPGRNSGYWPATQVGALP